MVDLSDGLSTVFPSLADVGSEGVGDVSGGVCPGLEYLALEEAFQCWYAENYSVLEAGASGDLFGLRAALTAAWPPR